MAGGISLSEDRRPKRATGVEWSAASVSEGEEPISTTEAEKFLSLPPEHDETILLAGIISGVRQLVEKRIQRLLVRRDVTVRWERVPDHATLPLPPHGDIQEVRRLDQRGDKTVLTSAEWYARGLDQKAVYPSGGAKDGLEVDYTAGYESLPNGLRMQMLRDIKDRFDQRDGVVVGHNVMSLPDSSAYDAWRVLS